MIMNEIKPGMSLRAVNSIPELGINVGNIYRIECIGPRDVLTDQFFVKLYFALRDEYYVISEKNFMYIFGIEKYTDEKRKPVMKRSGRYPWKCSAPIIQKPKKVIFSGPATIVIWNDNTKTIVKRREGEEDDREKAVMYCILKKACGNKAAMDKYLKLFLKDESEEDKKDEEKEEAGSSKSDWKKPRTGSGCSEGEM